MSFNKSKAMRSAERFLTQGKLQSAISEYKTIVENDSKDINTINMLGDLYVKCNDQKSAVNCYQQVAEHYNKQGFAKKAISIYNKIYRIEPESIEISAKLAELYRIRGSVAEAKRHYTDITRRYEEKGFRDKALEIWEILGEIDSKNSDIYIKIAEYYRQDNQNEKAAEAYIEAGLRLSEDDRDESAVKAFSDALEMLPENMFAVNGYVKSQNKLGYPEEAAKILEELTEKDPYNKEISHLLIDVYFEIDKPEKAEEIIIELVEREPANYSKLIDLIEIYLEKDDLESTVRILSMVSEHLLIDRKPEQLSEYINEVLARNPEQIEALRLLARFHGWQNDEPSLQKTLERLAEVSRENDSVEDENFALAQLLKLIPHDIGVSSRLKEINELYDFDDEVKDNQLWQETSVDLTEVPNFEKFDGLNNDAENDSSNGFRFETNGFEESECFQEAEDILFDKSIEEGEFGVDSESKNTDESDEIKGFEFTDSENKVEFSIENELKDVSFSNREVEEEVESIKFYIEQGYKGLAEKSLNKLVEDFGNTAEFDELKKKIEAQTNQNDVAPEEAEAEKFENITHKEFIEERINYEEIEKASDIYDENIETIPELETEFKTETENNNDFENFKDELGFEENSTPKTADDYENHYHYAVAYQEMGLLENAIREFQDAANCVRVNDGTRRFFQCCNLLGHCFMEKQMPHLALIWLEKAFETDDLIEDEKQGLKYELANAYQLNGETDKARELFEQIYTIDVDYRDVSERLNSLSKELIAQ